MKIRSTTSCFINDTSKRHHNGTFEFIFINCVRIFPNILYVDDKNSLDSKAMFYYNCCNKF